MIEDTLTSEILLFPDDETEGNEEWRITNDLAADWAIAKIKAARADLERKERLAAEKIAEVQRWIEGERQKTNHAEDFFTAKLREYFDSLDPAVLKKAKTQLKYELMSGSIKVKKQQSVFKRDNEALLRWLRDNQPAYIKTKEEPDWARIKEQLVIAGDKAVYRDTGEVVPGIEVEQQPDKFVVE
jgi:hypothetical protein